MLGATSSVAADEITAVTTETGLLGTAVPSGASLAAEDPGYTLKNVKFSIVRYDMPERSNRRLSRASASQSKHTVLAATTTAPMNVTPQLDNMRDVEHMHEVLCCAGTTSMLLYYDHYHGTGFGKARKADVREFRCPIKALMQGAATQKKCSLQTSSSGTKEVHAHAAHLDYEDVSCACCADQQHKRVHFAGPWPTLHSTADRPPEQKKKNVNRRNSGRNRSVQHNQQHGTKHFEEPAQGEPAQRCQRYDRGATAIAEQMEADLWLRGSVQQQHLHSH
jgi:hypothetical protein